MQRLAPNLPLMVARVGVELHLHTTFMHLLHDVASILDAWVLLATAQEEYVQLLVERLGAGQYARHLKI